MAYNIPIFFNLLSMSLIRETAETVQHGKLFWIALTFTLRY